MPDGDGDVLDAIGVERGDVPCQQGLPGKIEQNLGRHVPKRRPTPAARMMAESGARDGLDETDMVGTNL